MRRGSRARRASRSQGSAASGLLALLVLAVLVAGVPVALWTAVGWPLPHGVPSLGELRDAIDQANIPDEIYPKSLAVLAWLAWGQFMVSVVVEFVAARRGRLAARIPGSGWSQAIAARLVGTVLVFLSTAGMTRPVMAAPAPATPVVAQVTPPAPAAAPAGPTTTRPGAGHGPDRQTAARSSQHSPRIYVVKRHDTLWDIAERHLGDPLRWREIFDLNAGRPQPDGRRLQDAHWIYPGWRLHLPGDAVGLPASAERPAGGGGKSAKAAPSSTDEAAPPPSTEATPAPAPAPTPAPPSPEASPPTTLAEPETTSPTEPPVPDAGALGETPTGPNGAEILPAEVVGIGVLAAGVLATLAQLRRVQQRRRRTGRRIRLPAGGLELIERALRAEEAPEDARFLGTALRAMASGIREQDLRPPQVLMAALGADDLRLLLDGEAEAAPNPFTLAEDGRAWTLPRDVDFGVLERHLADLPCPLPALVTVGHTTRERLLLNLEGPGLCGLHGEPAAVRALLDAFATELATTSLTDFFELVLVGFGLEFDALERVQAVDGLASELGRLELQAKLVGELIDQLGCGSMLAGRVAERGGDNWTPTVVLCASPPPPAELERLLDLTATPWRSTASAVVAGLADGDWTVEVTRDLVSIPRLGLSARPQRLTPERYAAIASLLRIASEGDVDVTAPPYDELVPTATAPRAAAGSAAAVGPAPAAPALPPSAPVVRVREQVAEPPSATGATLEPPAAAEATVGALASVALDPAVPTGGLEVRVLGRVEIAGAPQIERSKSVELVVYLALRRHGVDSDRLWEALWPGRPPRTATLNSTTSVARSRLGLAPDGTPFLPRAHDGLYRLHPDVGLDWARFEAFASAGRGGAGGTEILREALDLVRGRPFDAVPPRSYGWAVVDGATMEAEIVDLAEELAQRYLRAGDHTGARWAARKGLQASPYDERLYRILMLAADAAGNPGGVDAVMEELLQVMEEEGIEPYDTLHETTRELYERLRRPRRRILG